MEGSSDCGDALTRGLGGRVRPVEMTKSPLDASS
jgi:hypothetical protein